MKRGKNVVKRKKASALASTKKSLRSAPAKLKRAGKAIASVTSKAAHAIAKHPLRTVAVASGLGVALVKLKRLV